MYSINIVLLKKKIIIIKYWMTIVDLFKISSFRTLHIHVYIYK